MNVQSKCKNRNYNFKNLRVYRRPGHPNQGQLIVGGRVLRCALGRGSTGILKREGDGKTPIGKFGLLGVYMRKTSGFRRSLPLPVREIIAQDGWCDAVGDRNYNQRVKLPYGASHEKLLREDHLYDVFFVMDHNVRQRMGRGGSAIFFHLAHDDYRPTEGCVAISRRDMTWLMGRLDRKARIVVCN